MTEFTPHRVPFSRTRLRMNCVRIERRGVGSRLTPWAPSLRVPSSHTLEIHSQQALESEASAAVLAAERDDRTIHPRVRPTVRRISNDVAMAMVLLSPFFGVAQMLTIPGPSHNSIA